MAAMSTAEKVRVNKARRHAARLGLRVRKSKVKQYREDDHGGFQIRDVRFDNVVAGHDHELDIEAVEHFLRIWEAAQENARAASSQEPHLRRTLAVRTSQLAGEYVDAAASVDIDTAVPPFPFYGLCGQAVELSCKSVLIVVGVSEKGLRRIGHNIARAYRLAQRMLPEDVAPETPEDKARVELLSTVYQRRALHYAIVGNLKLPDPHDMLDTAERLVSEVTVWVESEIRGGDLE